MRRLTPFSAKRDRRQIRAIRFDHESINRHLRGDFAHLFAVLERDDSGKGNKMAEIENLVRLIKCAAETMKDAADLPAVIAQKFESIIPGVALMNDDIES